MTKRSVIAVMACLFLFSAAYANSWGAQGWTVDAFDGGPWEEYTVLESSYQRSGTYAQVVATSRYHNELICMAKDASAHRKDETKIMLSSTAAVYQPGHEMAKEVRLQQTGDGFVLSYPEEWFRFQERDGRYLLLEAYLGDEDTTVVWRENQPYLFLNSYGRAELEQNDIYLEDFNIALFPRMKDAAHINRIWAALRDGNVLCDQVPTVLEFGNAPVYSAPDRDSWRAAKGKASVSLKAADEYTVYGLVNDWTLIEYKVSQRTSRIGYVPPGYLAAEAESELMSVPALILRDTYITDDPRVSQYPHFSLSQGEQVVLLGYDDMNYVYAQVQIDGRTMRGFIPANALTLTDHPLLNCSASGICRDVMAEMEGVWTIWAGGDMLSGNYTEFRADGTFNAYAEWDNMPSVKGGYWYVTPYDKDSGLSWAEPPYLVVMQRYDGYVSQRGLTMGRTSAEEVIGFGLGFAPGERTLNFTDEEGGGGYVNILPHLEKNGFIEDQDHILYGDHG